MRTPTKRPSFRSCLIAILLALLATHTKPASALSSPDQTAPASDAQSDQWADCPDKAPDFDLIPGAAEILRLVPKDNLLIGWYEVDLNLDGKLDALLVIAKSCGDRTLQVAIRQHDGSLSVVASNEHLILCDACTGSYGGYDIQTRPGQFTLSQHSGTGGIQESEVVTFVWSKKRHTWVVKEASFSAYDLKENYTNNTNEKSVVGMAFEDFSGQWGQ